MPKTSLKKFAEAQGKLVKLYSPAVNQMSKLSLELGEIAQQASDAEHDLNESVKRGEDLLQRILDLQTVFRRYERCYYEIGRQSLKISKIVSDYTKELSKL